MEVFAEWGAHEAKGRNASKVQPDLSDKFSCADYILRFRPALISAIIKLKPVSTALFELNENESNAIMLFDGKNLDQWIQDENISNDSGWEHIQTMVGEEQAPNGALVASVEYEQAQNTIGPLILWDGWHRAAAWHERCNNGKSSCITCYVILTAK